MQSLRCIGIFHFLVGKFLSSEKEIVLVGEIDQCEKETPTTSEVIKAENYSSVVLKPVIISLHYKSSCW